jgi:hypothetical protein
VADARIDLVQSVLAVHRAVLELPLFGDEIVVCAETTGFELVDALLNGAIMSFNLVLNLMMKKLSYDIVYSEFLR